MSYRHRTLSGFGTTRLLIIHPANSEAEPLRGSLIEYIVKSSHRGTSPEGLTRYEALSYVWGAPSTAHEITINSLTLPITANCDAALRRLRWVSQDRVLWVDSICIDQTPEGVEERNAQVAMMGDIYENASDVLIWLGGGDEKTDALFLHLKRLYELRDDSCEDARAEVNAQFMNECEHVPQIIEDILSRPWFERMWTLQELLLSSHATVQCGGQSMNWDAFCQALMLVEALFAPSSKGSRNFINCYYAYSDFKELVEVDAGAGVTRTEDDDESDVRKDLSTVVHHTRIRHATDPKDKIFAIYGISQKLGKPLPSPDYTESISMVYAKATAEIMRQDNSLWPLDNVWSGNRRTDLPSWVPDWSDDLRWSEDLLSDLGALPVNHGDRDTVNHWDGPVEHHDPEILISSDCFQLTLRAQTYGAINTVFDSHELVAVRRDVLAMSRTSAEHALAMRRHGAEQIKYFRRIYISLSAERDAKLRLQTFCRLLLTYSPTQPLKSFERGSEDLLSLLTASEDLETRRVITTYALDKLIKAADSNQHQDHIVKLVESDVNAALDVLLSSNLDCGSHEIYAKPHEPGYKVVHLLASATGFYNLIRGLIINRSIFTIGDGLLGYAYGQVHVRDVIAKFQGATSPHVLRPYEPNAYQIISPAVVKADREISPLVEGRDWAEIVLI
ncbi:heterokaryon incompatibility protein-domain-containing protein [Hypoxylon rubiginosum]|uniref:Heterokaryon incompatibility protein-domain-containing protein n=1 Tax=Hypoxylon rubiginosum TaxID=110542 RepID=A0ACC0CWF1_9PEZI|nr:heterokaryon incompatibility protein-domain-containing protein [Hypoxylon rubiginosum]